MSRGGARAGSRTPRTFLTGDRSEAGSNRSNPPLRGRNSNAYSFDFLREREIFTVPEYMRLNADVRTFVPPERRDFFTQVDYRDVLSFRVKDFLDQYFAKGLIPAALIGWEMTGHDDGMKFLLK